jgi:hypothetical protein
MRESNKTSLQNQKRDQQWIDEAIASGPETPLTKKEMRAIRDRVLRDKHLVVKKMES